MDESIQWNVLRGTAMLPAYKLMSKTLRRLVEETLDLSHGSAGTFADIFQHHVFLQDVEHGAVDWSRCTGLGMQSHAYVVASARNDGEMQYLCVAWSRAEIVWVAIKTSHADGLATNVSQVDVSEVDAFLQEKMANANWHLNDIAYRLKNELSSLDQIRSDVASAYELLSGALGRINWSQAGDDIPF